jgi:RecB family exonuclease
VSGERAPGHLAALRLDPQLQERLAVRLAVARAFDPAPKDLRSEYVLAKIAERKAFGGTTLEEYATCSYRWLVGRLDPKQIDPQSEGLAHGGAAHNVLEELYRHPPAPGSRPTRDTLSAWEQRAGELLKAEVKVAGGGAAERVGRHRLLTLILAFLRRDAERRDTYDDVQVEVPFGMEGQEGPDALSFGDWELHGKIDRIDVDRRRGTAIVHDYKLGAKVTPHGSFEKQRKMQLALYLRAVEQQLDLRPDAGLYHPLGRADNASPRGLAREEVRDETLEPLGLQKNDWLTDEKFGGVIERAEELASGYVARIRGGEVDRDPLDDKCPWYCTFAPICRMDRQADPGVGAGPGGENGSSE